MSQPGDNDALIPVRSTLLDALVALQSHLDAIVVIGAQAIYLHTGEVPLALAPATNDSDLAIDPRQLRDDPLIEAAMKSAHFYPNPFSKQPGAWLNPAGIPVDPGTARGWLR